MTAVSVIIPAYRAEATLVAVVASVLAQSWRDLEVVVVSDDRQDYAPLLRGAGLDDGRLVFAATGRVGAGAAAAMAAGQRVARGAFLTRLDADDIFLPERLETLMPLAERHGAATDNAQVVEWPGGAEMGSTLPPGDGWIRLGLDAVVGSPVPWMLVARREFALEWWPRLAVAPDVWHNAQVFRHLDRLPVCRRPLWQYRVRRDSLSHTPEAAQRIDADYALMLDRLNRDGGPAALAAAVTGKRALNRAFIRELAAQPDLDFQTFAFGTRALALAEG